jgi:hypothetical protein
MGGFPEPDLSGLIRTLAPDTFRLADHPPTVPMLRVQGSMSGSV